jgi:hypothetical protein
MTATPHLTRLVEIAHKTRQANDIAKFDDAAWIMEHLFELANEVHALQQSELLLPDTFEKIATNLLTHMDVILEKCRGVTAKEARIKQLESQLAGIA